MVDGDIERFIARWAGQEGGQERANYGLFLSDLCDVLAVPRPQPAGDLDRNDYVFERVVKEKARDGTVASKRIDRYRRDSLILEAKQSRWKGGRKQLVGQVDLFVGDDGAPGTRG